LVAPKEGFLIVDDTTLDKPYSEKIGFVRYQWNGKHYPSVKGIGLVTLLWTDGNKILPVDFRIYNIDEDEKTKNDRQCSEFAVKFALHPLVFFFIYFPLLYTNFR
jgi:putative transposase